METSPTGREDEGSSTARRIPSPLLNLLALVFRAVAAYMCVYVSRESRKSRNIHGSRIKRRRDLTRRDISFSASTAASPRCIPRFLCAELGRSVDRSTGRSVGRINGRTYGKRRGYSRFAERANSLSQRQPPIAHTYPRCASRILRERPALSPPRDVRCAHACLRPDLVEKRALSRYE